MDERARTTRWGKRLVIAVASLILFLAGSFDGKIGMWSLPGIAAVEAASYCLGQPDGTLCDDSKPCTVNDVCTAGVCAGVPKSCDDGNECTSDSCNTTTGACIHTNVSDNTICEDSDGNFCTGLCSAGLCTTGVRPTSYCQDDTACTIDACNSATGCVHTAITGTCYNTTANNFTMLDPGNGLTGGTNDVVFTWDGICNSSVATAVVNATISSDQGFFGPTWAAHDVMVYCPGGPYEVHSDAVAGDPSCALGMDAGLLAGSSPSNIPSGAPCTRATYTFTVGTGQLGGHMLFYWNGNDNIDVVDVWSQGTFSGPFYTGADNGEGCSVEPCGARNTAAKVWDLASIDWDGDGVQGASMIDGPFAGFNANFNVMKIVTDKCAGIDCSPSALASQCLSGACDTATGRCVYTPINESSACNDNNACTSADLCVSGACTGTAINCDDNNACTANNCNRTTGVCSNPAAVTCNDSNPCTMDSCIPATGNCAFTPLANGTACTPPFGSAGCIIGTTCQNGSCGTPKDCSDNNPCTVDTCAAFTGGTCVHTPIACTDSPACITPSCDTATGSCVFAPRVCTDNNACTTDSCDTATGCVFAPIVCNDNNACTADTCNTATGCVHTAICGVAKIGIFTDGTWYIDQNGNGAWDGAPTDALQLFGNGVANAIPVTGDWSGTGTKNIGIYENGTWYIDQNGNGAWDGAPTDALQLFGNGVANAIPVTGNWTGTGTTRIGIYGNGTWYLDLNGNKTWDGTPTDAQYSFGNGVSNAIPVTGDWTGTGTARIGIYANGTWFLDLNGNGVWDGTLTDAEYSFGSGIANAIPVTGDWTGTGTTRIGIYVDGTWFVDLNGNGVWDSTPTDAQYLFGNGVAGALPVTGK